MTEKKTTDVKKRGRPKIEKEVDNRNENTDTIKMSQKNVVNHIVQEEAITLTRIQQRWTEVFKKYGTSGLSFDAMKTSFDNAMLDNPFIQNSRIKQISSQIHNKEKKDIQSSLLSPQNNEQFFREASMSLNFQNYVYNSLLRLNREIPKYYCYAVPKYLNKKEMKNDNFRKESQFVDKIIKKFNPQLTLKTINMQVQQEGKCSYLVRKSYDSKKKVDFFLLQKLNSDMVKLTGIGSKQHYIASFNMMIFLNPMYDVSQYPAYIGEIWEQMQEGGLVVKDKKTTAWKFEPKGTINKDHILEYSNGSYFYWIQLSQNDCVTFGQDMSTPMALPETIGLFLDFKELSDYKWLMGNLMAKSVTTLLTGSVPIAKDAKAGSDATIISPDLITLYDNMFSQSVAGNVLTYFAPFTDFKLHDIPNQPDNMNIVFNRTRDLIASSGNAALLSINDKPSIAMTKGAQSIAAARVHYLTLQFELFLNNVINSQFELKNEYEITLWGDIFDKEELKTAKELLMGGMKSMLPKVLSAFDQSLEDCATINDYIDALGIKVLFLEKKENQGQSKKPVGRQPLNEDEIENDSTADSLDAGTNVSDTKEFNSIFIVGSENEEIPEIRMCEICKAELNEEEEFLCDNCLEEQYQDRVTN